jgi:hypothetical protein
LARYGLAPSAGALAAVLAEKTALAQVPISLAASTARAAVLVARGLLTAGTVPAQVVALTEGVIKTMLLTKLKSFVAVALVLIVSAGAVGLTQGTGPRESGQAPTVAGARPRADDLEALRLEVEALRKALQATRERVKTLEAEVQALRRTGGAAPPSKDGSREPVTRPPVNTYRERLTSPQGSPPHREATQDYSNWLRPLKQSRLADDPVVQAEAALKAIREARDPDARRRAADALEKALKRLKEREQPQGTPRKGPGN